MEKRHWSSYILFILVILALCVIGGIWGTEILYGIVPALIVAPIASIFFVMFQRKQFKKIEISAILIQFGFSVVIAIVLSIIIALSSFFFHDFFKHPSNTTIYIALIITLILSSCASIFLTKQNIVDLEKQESLNKREIRKKERQKEKEKEIKNKYGVCGLVINDTKGFENEYLVRVFYQTKTVILKKYDILAFSDIKGCTIEKREEKGETIQITTTPVPDNKSIIGRSLVGGLIAGAPGAIIGGLTAKSKEKEEWKFVPCTLEKYKVLIQTNRQYSPIITIDTDKDKALAENI